MMDPQPEIPANPSKARVDHGDELRSGVLQNLLNVLSVLGTVAFIYNLAILLPIRDWISIALYGVIFVGLFIAT
ncbi:hypothetical protein EG834_16270, partial [bacterium]|nr:hypothetical protein [bacterium]